MKKVVFICPFFGPLPEWIAFFLASCARNPSIDFLFYCDAPCPQDWPENIRYQQMSFEDYKQLVSGKLDIEFNPNDAYKLCDIKPAYGLIHAEDIAEYDFWGFCDIDLVFGNIRTFLNEELLNSYEFYSTHANRVAGHFCIMRNTDEWKVAFKRCKNWRRIFESQSHYAFDEKNFSRLLLSWKNYPVLISQFLRYHFSATESKSSYKGRVLDAWSAPQLDRWRPQLSL